MLPHPSAVSAQPGVHRSRRFSERRSPRSAAALLAAVAALLISACGSAFTVPATPSPPPAPRNPAGAFLAGFGVSDITPPPGPGLFGYGPEGKQARGFRQRLQARTMLLEDSGGERIAIVVVELGAVPHHLQRRVAERLRDLHPDGLGLGDDRIFLAATHTHAGPSNFLGGVFDANASTVSGHDPHLLDFLVRGIVVSVERAFMDRGPARLSWGRRTVWGLTRNRSLLPFLANEPRRDPEAPDSLPASEQAVDPGLWMLRVDRLAPDGSTTPRGLLTLFAIHGTAVPSANTLYDPDIHGRVARLVEQRLGTEEGRAGPAGVHREVVHLFANAAGADISPGVPPSTRCPVARKRTLVPALVAALAPAAGWAWEEPPEGVLEACLEGALRELDLLAERLAEEMVALHGELDPARGAEGAGPGITLARAHHLLMVDGDIPGLCPEPLVGAATPGGVADGVTRLQGHLGIREGRVDPDPGRCQSPKVPFLGALQGLVASEEDYPGAAPFAVIRIGDLLLGTVPAEVTVTAGARMRDAMMEGAREAGWEPRAGVLMTLTGGYLYYTTTREEYGLQFYEGSSTLRGPGQAEVFARTLGTLAARLPREGGSPAEGPSEPGGQGTPLDVQVPTLRTLLPPSRLVEPPPPIPLVGCAPDGSLTARWLDLDPARRLPRPGPWVTLVRDDTGEVVATDADPRLEMVMGELDPLGRWWSLRDTATRPGVAYRVVVAGHRGDTPIITCPRPGS